MGKAAATGLFYVPETAKYCCNIREVCFEIWYLFKISLVNEIVCRSIKLQ